LLARAVNLFSDVLFASIVLDVRVDALADILTIKTGSDDDFVVDPLAYCRCEESEKRVTACWVSAARLFVW